MGAVVAEWTRRHRDRSGCKIGIMLKRTLRPEVAVFCVAAYVLIVFNLAFWKTLQAAVAPSTIYEWSFLAAVFIVGLCFLNLLFGLFAARYVFKPAMTVFLLVTAAAAYFVNDYGVVIDVHMVRNIFQTDRAEAGALMTPRLFVYLLVLGGLPVLLVWRCRIEYRPFWKEVRFKALAALGVSAIIVATAVAVHAEYHLGVPRASRAAVHVRAAQLSACVLGLRAQPIENQVGSGSPVRRGRAQGRQGAPQKIPHRHRDRRDGARGEFLLERLCAAQPIRCSARCRTSSTSRTGLLVRHRHRAVGALHVLGAGTGRLHLRAGDRSRRGCSTFSQRAGFSVLWRENQSRLQGRVQAGSHRVRRPSTEYRKFYELGNSLDENLLTGLQEKIDQLEGDAVVVLHMMGSHGPAYYQALSERVRALPARLQGKPVQPLHAASRSSTATTTRSSTPTTSCPG